MTGEQIATLSKLADGIIPADEIDAGAAAVDAGRKLAQKVDAGANAKVYVEGIQSAEAIARARYAAPIPSLDPRQVHDLLGVLRSEAPAFFRQLRADVCALYLSDPAVWQRIGFPGPSTEAGGYPDFDQVQVSVHGRGK